MTYHYQKKSAFEANFAKKQEENPSKWMVTFSDLLSIIITFFVLIYSMSTVINEDWNQITNSFNERLNPNHLLPTSNAPAIEHKELTEIKTKKAEDLEYLKFIILDNINNSPTLKKLISISSTTEELTIHVQSNTLFLEGETNMTNKGARITDILTNILHSINNRIDIYAYADDIPRDTKKYPTSWELSLSRGLVIAQLLRNKGYTYTMSTFARSRYTFNRELSSEDKSEKQPQHIQIVIQREKTN